MSTVIQGMPRILVAAALAEELNAFYKIKKSAFAKKVKLEGQVFEVKWKINGQQVKVLTYTPNQMGMPYNAAALATVVALHKPDYTLFIGTCACLNDEKKAYGDVLIPSRVFSYESGKYRDGKFLPDYISFETGDLLRKKAEELKTRVVNTFQIITDEQFCSGAAVIDDEEKRNHIIDHSARKVTGLDMEAYSVACLNSILKPKHELLVIKGIMDFAKNKFTTEATGSKELAKTNSAQVAFQLIEYIFSDYIPKPSKKEKKATSLSPNPINNSSILEIMNKSSWELSFFKDPQNPGKEIVFLDKQGQYIANGYLKFYIKNIQVHENLITWSKVYHNNNKIHSVETLYFNSPNSLTGTDSLGYNITYRRKE